MIYQFEAWFGAFIGLLIVGIAYYSVKRWGKK